MIPASARSAVHYSVRAPARQSAVWLAVDEVRQPAL
jgi:hypothetical protein